MDSRFFYMLLELTSGGELFHHLGRGLHSSTFWLNVSIFCGIHWLHAFPLVYLTGERGEV